MKKRTAHVTKAVEPKASPLEASPDNTPITVAETHIPQAVGPNEEGLTDQVNGAHEAAAAHHRRTAKQPKET